MVSPLKVKNRGCLIALITGIWSYIPEAALVRK